MGKGRKREENRWSTVAKKKKKNAEYEGPGFTGRKKKGRGGIYSRSQNSEKTKKKKGAGRCRSPKKSAARKCAVYTTKRKKRGKREDARLVTNRCKKTLERVKH